MRVAPAVVLSPEERAALLRWRDAPRTDPDRAVRARAVLLAATGQNDTSIARALRVQRRTVARWRRRFLDGRLRGIGWRTAPVRAGSIPEELLQRIVRASIRGQDPRSERASTRRLAREFGVSHMTVHRLREAYAVPPASPTPMGAPWDAVTPLEPGDVVGLLLQRGRAAIAVTLRPAGGGSDARRARGGDAPIGSRATVGRAVLAFRRLERRSAVAPPGSSVGYLRFLVNLQTEARAGTPILVVLVRSSNELGATLERWRMRHPDVSFEIVSDLDRWKRRALELLRSSGRRSIPRRQFHGPAELSRSVSNFVAAFDESDAPVSWVARRHEIEAGNAGYRLRADLAAGARELFGTQGRRAGSSSTDRVESDDAPRRMARSILREYLRLREREALTIDAWSGSVEYANALVIEALRIGARPLLLLQDEPTYWAATTEVAPRHLANLGEHRRAALERTDALVTFFGPSDRERFHALPSKKMFRLGEYQDAVFRAAARGGARVVQLAMGRLSPASARLYGIGLAEWEQELVGATTVSPSTLHRRGRGLLRRLASGRELVIRHPNGTRLALRLRGLAPQLDDGVLPSRGSGRSRVLTLPTGVIAVAVDDRFAEGTFRSNVTASVGLSDTIGEMAGARWTFRNGRLAAFSYDAGEEYFAQSFERAGPGRDRPALVSIGLNDRLRRAPLLEDQALGMIGMHLGRNEHLGGRTKLPWWAWSFLEGGTLEVDGHPLVTDGRLRRS